MSEIPPPAPGCTPCAVRDEEIAQLREQLREQLAARDAEVTGLREQIAANGDLAELKDRLTRLERAVSRNSGNSSMPPSGDDTPGRKPRASSGGPPNATQRRNVGAASSPERRGRQ